jgi:hypothetical protein
MFEDMFSQVMETRKMISTLLLSMFFAAAPTSAPLPSTAVNAKPVTFRFIDLNAASVPGMCVKVTV